jgi:hypothetical protein
MLVFLAWVRRKLAPHLIPEGAKPMTATDKKAWYRSWNVMTALTVEISVGLVLIFWPLIPSKTEWKSQNHQGEFLTALTSIFRENDTIVVDYYIKDLRPRQRRKDGVGMGHVTYQYWDAAGELTEVAGLPYRLGDHKKRDGLAGWLGMRHDTKITTFEAPVPPRAELFAVRFDLDTGYSIDSKTVLSTKPVPLPPREGIGRPFDRRKLEPSGDNRQMHQPDGSYPPY